MWRASQNILTSRLLVERDEKELARYNAIFGELEASDDVGDE